MFFPVALVSLCPLAWLGLTGSVLSSDALASESIDIEVGSTDLISLRVLPEDASPQAIFGEASADAPTLQNSGFIALPHGGVWLGNLERLSRTQSYWLLGGAAGTVTVTGEPTDADIAFQLRAGVNFVAFPCAEAVEVPQAIPDDVELLFMSIFGAGTAASQSEGLGWVGMSHLQPGAGYQVNVSGDIEDFRFECPASDGVDPYVYGCSDGFASNADSSVDVDDGSCAYNIPAAWQGPPANDGTYSHVLLHDVRLEGAPLDASEDAVGVFAEGSFVGFGYTRQGYSTIAVNVHSEASAGDVMLSFQVYDASEDATVDLEGQVLFQSGAAQVGGCTDSEALNYNDWVDFDIGNCVDCETEVDCEAATVCAPQSCDGGQCVAYELDCDDGDACTEDSCDEMEGCVNRPLGYLDGFEECGERPTDFVEEGCGCAVPLERRTLTPFFLLLLAAVTMRRKRQEN